MVSPVGLEALKVIMVISPGYGQKKTAEPRRSSGRGEAELAKGLG